MMMLVGRNTHARIILLTLMSILLQIIWSFRMPHSPSNHKYSYCSQIHLNGDLNGHGLQMAAYDSTVVHNAPVDYSSLAVDDPLFADMPWPTESGTAESKAFANHIQWKRKLSDGERLRWHRWAIYQRIGKEARFDYSAQDYIFQNMMAQLRSRSQETRLSSSPLESHLTPAEDLQGSIFHTLQLGFAASERDEVTAVMRAYYSAFNRKNFDELRYLWLPAENSELTLPGYDKVRGGGAINKLYYQLEKEMKPLGTIHASISKVQCFGCVSLVHTVETVLPDSGALRTVKKKGSPAEDGQVASSKLPKRRVLATTILRKFNKQWRIVCHHAQRMGSSPYTGDQVVSGRPSPKGRPQQGSRLGASVLRGNEIKAAAAMSDIFGSSTKEEPMRGVLFKRSDTDDRVLAVEALKGNSPVGGDSKGGAKGRSSVVDGLAIDYQFGDPRPSKPSKGKGGMSDVAPDTKKGAALIDDSAATCKQTVQALRLLQRVGIISDEMKQFLISDIVENLVYDKISLTETAFEMLYMYPRKGRPQLRDDALQSASLKDFADQCAIIAAKLSATSPYASVYRELSSSISINNSNKKKKQQQQQQFRKKSDRSVTFNDDFMSEGSEVDSSTMEEDDDVAEDEEVIVAIDDFKDSPDMDVDYDDQNDD